MSHKKLELGRDFTKTHTRITSLQGIDERLDLGNGVSLDNLKAADQQLRGSVDAYNTLLEQADAKRRECMALRRSVRKLNSRILAGVGAVYGKDSSEYEKAGGIPVMDGHKRRAAKKSS